MVGEGIIEIGGDKHRRSREEVRMLKSILDQLRILHIIDDFIFYSTIAETERMKETRKIREWKFEKDGGVSLENRVGHNGRFECRKLTISDPFEKNSTRLILLDDEEYKFLGGLFY